MLDLRGRAYPLVTYWQQRRVDRPRRGLGQRPNDLRTIPSSAGGRHASLSLPSKAGEATRPTAANRRPGLTKHSEETQANSQWIHRRLRLRSARPARARPYGLPRRRDLRVAQRIDSCSGNEHRARDRRSKENGACREVAELPEERTAPCAAPFFISPPPPGVPAKPKRISEALERALLADDGNKLRALAQDAPSVFITRPRAAP
jgi:hypothetical protein